MFGRAARPNIFGAAENSFPIGRAFFMKFSGCFIGCLFTQSFGFSVP